MKGVSAQVDIHKIRVNGGAQTRAALDEETIAEYAEAMSGGAVFPPIVVFYDGASYWLADGFHRRKAALRLKWTTIAADVRQGTERDAILYSVGANATHGLRRTNADKRRAVLTLLNDAEWGRWSDREIARRCGVSHDTVSRLRRESTSLSDSDSEAAREFVTRHGTPSTMRTANIGRSRYASTEWEALAERNENNGRESRPGLDEWVEQDDGEEEDVRGFDATPDIQTTVDNVLRGLGGSRNDPLWLYQMFVEVRRQARDQGRELSDFLYGQTEEEISEAIKKRIARAYPEIEPEKIAEDERARILARKEAEEAAHRAARPYGSFDETAHLFEMIGLALVTHPDRPANAEHIVRRLCHQLIETGFGMGEIAAKAKASKKGSAK